jgi:hypothetical protein
MGAAMSTLSPLYPALFQCNIRVLLTQLATELGRTTTLDDIPDRMLDGWRDAGMDWIWLLSVWQTGAQARQVSRSHAGWRSEFQHTLSDLQDEDIGGSGFAITDYRVHQSLGGDAALERLRSRMRERGLRLMLDFVPNHMGLGHPWLESHPHRFILGSQALLERESANYMAMSTTSGSQIIAYGRDPHFEGWPDTLQLDYSNPETQVAMRGELLRMAGQCDGVRCDMAMLIEPDVFFRTWGRRAVAFWPEAIQAVKARWPEFCFMAEVYWDMEWTLQQHGFDMTYDKRLYDRLRDGHARPVRLHLHAELEYQRKMVRMLENHDEPRAAATFPLEKHRAAAAITYFMPGMRFFHDGQWVGKRLRVSPHLIRGPMEPVDTQLETFYARLLELLRGSIWRHGEWQLLECTAAWDGNGSHEDFVVWAWHGPSNQRRIVAVNYSEHRSQCHVRLPWDELRSAAWCLQDQWNIDTSPPDTFVWSGDDLLERGLYLDEPAWGTRVFSVHTKKGSGLFSTRS